MKTLHEALLEQSPQMLRAIADMHRVTLPEGGTRDHAAAHLAQELARPEAALHAYESLTAAERAVLDGIVAKGGRVKAFQMLRDFGEIRSFGPVALAREKPWLSPVNVTERLWYLGFIQKSFDVVGEFRGEIFFVPEEMLAHLPKAASETDEAGIRTAPAPDSVSDHADALLWDMFSLMAYVARVEPPLDEALVLRVADLRAVERDLQVQDGIEGQTGGASPRLALLLRLGRTAKLIRAMSEGGVRLGGEARNWLRGTRQAARLRLFEAWKRERAWNELFYVPTLKVEETGWRNDPRLARETVVRFLARCPVLTWVTVPSFVARIRKEEPDFQRPDGDYDRWHLRDAATGKLLTGFGNWNAVEGSLIAYMLEGPLRWLGIVSIGGAAGEPAAFRISEFGARALGLSEHDLPEPAFQRFVVQGDYDVLVPEGAPLYARFQLERMSERVRWDRVSTYRLSRESVTRLLRRGVTVEQVTDFLKRMARPPFPKNVEYTLREWSAKYGEVTLRRAAVLHTRDQHLLAELQQHPELKGYILEVLSPTVALVAPEKLEELQGRLEALGYSPRVEGGRMKAEG